ncbi:MAG: hypothetical protein ACRDNF_05785, partial [Streptosporangiaceae bacterium]
IGSAAAGLIAVAVARPPGLVGATPIAGPSWLLALLPLLLGAPLVLRRRTPLLMWIAMWAGIALQDLIARHPSQSLYVVFVLFAGAYSLGAHASGKMPTTMFGRPIAHLIRASCAQPWARLAGQPPAAAKFLT